ncbi:LOW QUALITY PROTEIN: hypothetical protein B0H65DRAFT_509570 [Neurospora tetraspora]|uniref:F-box domain-containing protein n=1 Tax=Neurospora tetraspora TaxID=94610 RepID=A0AAE0JC63_9PEZI|nr:LOW QUALITY PROTEIN: hypothetical protein B0H65DRAFT_509570 [Neurospora tetraspora]
MTAHATHGHTALTPPTPHPNLNISDLPHEILLLILSSLPTAADVSHLGLTCRRLRRLVTSEGWRAFVIARFPSLVESIPTAPAPISGSGSGSGSGSQGGQQQNGSGGGGGGRYGWQEIAESLTWQSRCWDKRAVGFCAIYPTTSSASSGTGHGHGHGQRGGGGQQGQQGQQGQRGNMFQSVVDAHFDFATGRELLIWARRRDWGGGQKSKSAPKFSWFKAEGREEGALCVVRGDVPLSGKGSGSGSGGTKGNGGAGGYGRGDNGDLALGERFGKRIVRFRPQEGEEGERLVQDTINSVDVLYDAPGGRRLLAAATKKAVGVYALPDGKEEVGEDEEVSPVVVYDLQRSVLDSNTAQLCSAKWMGGQGNVMALALKGCSERLQYLSITESGWTHHTTAKSIINSGGVGGLSIPDADICANSLSPVYANPNQQKSGGTTLLLSAWKDGTCRLQDLRTSSPYDAIYQDNIQPWDHVEAILTYGTERFVAGAGNSGATIKIFDFRWPKPYSHTSALPCLGRQPFPKPHQPFAKAPNASPTGRARCDYLAGLECHWHSLSKHLYYRPNATIFLPRGVPGHEHDRSNQHGFTRTWSLAKASDSAPNFYMGVSGGVIEANLQPAPSSPSNPVEIDPIYGYNYPYFTGPLPVTGHPALSHSTFSPYSSRNQSQVNQGAAEGYTTVPIKYSLMETGDGLSVEANDRSIRMPRMMGPFEPSSSAFANPASPFGRVPPTAPRADRERAAAAAAAAARGGHGGRGGGGNLSFGRNGNGSWVTNNTNRDGSATSQKQVWEQWKEGVELPAGYQTTIDFGVLLEDEKGETGLEGRVERMVV